MTTNTQLTTALDTLKRCIGCQQPLEAKKHVESILSSLESDLSDAELDLAIEILFNESNGTLIFLKKTLHQNKLFKDSNINIFALYRNLILNHKNKISRYANDITDCLWNFILSSSVSAKEKELCILIIQEFVTQKICQNINITELVKKLLVIFTLKNPTSRFLQFSLELVGMLTKDFPECFDENQIHNFRDVLFHTLENPLIKQEKITFTVITGALQAFNYFFYNFAPHVDDEPIICQKIYDYIKKLSDPMDLKDRSAFRCSLNLITHHGMLISYQLFTDRIYWHNLFKKWLTYSWEDRKCAIYAIHSFHQEISRLIEKRNNSDDKNILKFFIENFKRTLLSPLSKSYEIRIAIRGFGVMAAPCKALLPPEYLSDLLTLVMQRTEYAYFCDKSQQREILEHLPDFIQALSQIMGYITGLSGIQITSLQNIIVALIKDFSFLSTIHHELVVTSLITTFYNLSLLGGTILDDLLKKVILQGVIWTCSSKLTFDIDWDFDWKENITYKSYLPLWIGLLNMDARSDIDRPMIVKKIYDHFINTLIIILDKLNLKTTKRTFKDATGIDQELYFCDPNIDLNPLKPKDFHLFFNLVDLYKDILKAQTNENNKQNFEKWIVMLTEVIITKYHQYPLISGFLKLLAVVLKIGDNINYFNEDIRVVERNIRNLNIIVSQFIKTIIFRCQQTSGELQISCLLLIFATPTSILQEYIMELSSVFVIAFEIGKSMIWLASYALRTVKKLNETVLSQSVDNQTKFLREVLPCLDKFLLSKGFTEKSNINVEIIKFRSKKIAKKSLQVKQSESELTLLQKDIILFLGTLEPQNCLHLITSDSANLIKWDVGQKISLSLDAIDMKPTIYLDTLLPRVCTLAITSSDRKTKIAACELLHACVLYLIGTNNYRGNIWSKICEQIFYLGCDTDTIVQEMFEPLLTQLMHYLSQSSQINNPGVKILLDCLMNLISHPSNCAVRDLSVKCLREFLSWAIKQTTPEQLKGSAFRIEGIIKRLSSYSFDSSENHRFGACLAFNNLYRVLREEESLIDQYWLELLYIYCTNFIMSEEFSTISTDLEQISTTLDHLSRVLCEKSDIFERKNDKREKTNAYTETTLKGAVIWLFKQCGSKQINYRRKCMDIFIKISACLKEFDSTAAFIETTFSQRDILEICEGTINGTGILARPNLDHIKDSKFLPIISVTTWLQHFLSSLDCYTWLISENLITDTQRLFYGSHICEVITYYLNNICWSSVYEIIESINPNFMDISTDTTDIIIGSEEIYKITSIKCKITIMIINLLIKLLSNCPNNIPNGLWDVKFTNLILDMIFGPHELGIDLKTPEILEKLPNILETVLQALKDKAPKEYSDNIFKEILNETVSRFNFSTNCAEAILLTDIIDEKQLNSVKGIHLVCQTINLSLYKNQAEIIKVTAEKLINDLFNGLKKNIFDYAVPVIITPSVKRYANILLVISFTVNDFVEILLNCILDETNLRQTNTETIAYIKHGEHFLEIYKITIFVHLLKSPKVILKKLSDKMNEQNSLQIIKILIQLTEFTYKYKDESLFLINYIETILTIWPKILDAIRRNIGSEIILIELMSHLAMASPFNLYELGLKAINFNDWLISIISNKENSLELKSRAIFLIPCITGPDDLNNNELSDALRNLQIQHFPLKSSEFPVESLERTGLVTAFRAILDALVVSKSPILLKFLINSTAADPKHILEYQIQESLLNFMKNKKVKHQLQSINIALDTFNDTHLEPSIRLIVMKRFLLPIIRGSYVNTIVEFYKNNIKKCIEMINTNYGSSTGGGWELERDLVTRMGGFQLLEILFASISFDKLVDKTCPISIALLGENAIKTGKEMIGDLMKRAFKVRTDVFITDDLSASELFRKYQCAAYNTICTIISNTQDDLKYYNLLIFKENIIKNEYIWRKIINCKNNVLYKFTQDFDDYPKIKERIVSIRSTAQNNRTENGKPVKYLESINLFDSSLSQDMTKLDLTNSYVRTNEDIDEIRKNEITEDIHKIHLENMPLNDHEVMATICAVINHLYNEKITPIPGDLTKLRTVAPQWVESICSALSDQENHKNIRLFLAKVIDNCRDIFRNYANFVLAPIMQLIVNECAGNTLNSFITDLTSMILSWNDIYLPNTVVELTLASSLLKFLMKNAYHQRKEIFKLNLELIKNIVEIWKNSIQIPIQFLFDSIQYTQSTDSCENIAGVHLNAIILANGLVPWTDLTKIDFIRAIFNCLNNDNALVYLPAAQLIGMCLQHLNPIGDELDEPCLKELIQNIEKIRKTSEKKFLNILYCVQKNYPIILDTFLSVICHNIPTAIGTIKKLNLEMLLARIEKLENETYRELISIDIINLLKQNEYQILALHILNKAMPNLTSDEINTFMNDICSFIESKKPECRDIMYEILIYIREKNDINTEKGNEIIKRASTILLVGLNDTNSQIQNRIFNFWSDEKQLSANLGVRLNALLGNLFDHNSERFFLGYCTQLLLEPVIRNPNSKRQIFEHITENDHKLTEYSINTNWKSYNRTVMSPLFIESQQSQITSDGSQIMAKYLRATQTNLMFEPTQDPIMMSQTQNNFSLPTQSSLIFDVQPQMLNRRSQKMLEPGGVEVAATDSFDRFRKRFIRDKDKISKEQALRAVDRHHLQHSKSLQDMKRKEGEVNLYRRYRIGDHPDLLINSLALLLPLQGLVKRDAILARQVFVSLFNAITKELSVDKTLFIRSISEHIENILNQTKTCEPTLFGALIEITLTEPKAFRISPDIISVVSNCSNMMTSGILYLESRLNVGWDDDDTSSSKSTSSYICNESNHWIKLSELYYQLSENDIVSSIYSDKLNSNPALGKGIILENEGNFKRAQVEYINIIKSVQRNQYEIDFCFQSLFNCYMHMGMWSELTTTVQKQLTNVEEFWSDNWFKNDLLPHFIKSEVRLILTKENTNRDFLNIIEVWLRDTEKLEYLTLNFGEELMMLQLANKEYRQAKVYSEKCLLYFLCEWEQLNILSNKLRANKLLNMCKIAEIHQYIEIITNNNYNKSSRELLWQQWNNINPKKSESILLLDCLITYRQFILNIFNEQANSIDLINDNNYVEKLNDTILDMKFKLLDVAAEQNYVHLFEKNVINLCDLENNKNNKRYLDWTIARSQVQILKARLKHKPDSVKLLIKSWDRINGIITDDLLIVNPDIHIRALHKISTINQHLLDLVSEHNFNDDELSNIKRLASSNNAENINERLYKQSIWCLQECVNIATTSDIKLGSKMDGTKLLAETNLNVALFCYDIHEKDDNNLKTIENERNIIVSVLRAMQYDSKQARQMFSCLLQLPGLQTEELQLLFNAEIKCIPEWMFLGWIPQILSFLTFSEPCYLDKLILRIAETYPNALVYPFQLSLEQYIQLNNLNYEFPNNREFIVKLIKLLKNPLIETFIENMKQLCLPRVKLNFHLNKLFNLVTTKRENCKYEEEVNNLIKTFNLYKNQNNKKYFENFFKQFDDTINKLKSYSLEANIRLITTTINELILSNQNEMKKMEEEIDLKMLCPWLVNFKWIGEENYLELPGQYSGEHKPNIHLNIKIIKFDNKLKIFQSIRKPVKLKIYGDDGKIYNFIVKYGEDIRQDERIQRLFTLMSTQMETDKNCRNHNLKIQTYEVIPINCYCGMISFVEDTETLKNFVSIKERLISNANKEYSNFIQSKKFGDIEMYGAAACKKSRDVIITNFKKIQNSLPSDLLKNALMKIAASPETFYVLRNNYATSLATMNIAHWILGIGDRHLSNILINSKTGSFVGIDFGVSFGAGLRDLGVPELIPFRLTPQLVHVMNPFGTSGLLSKCMIHSLRCFRSSSKLLMACMEVFVKEPTMDWLEIVRKNARGNDDSPWNSSNRIKIASRKLNGDNPCILSVLELQQGTLSTNPKYSEILQGYIKLLKGVEQFNIRTKLPEKDLSVEEQVQVLIDMATDPALLGVTYIGFQPFC